MTRSSKNLKPSEAELATAELPDLDVWPSVPPRYCPACRLRLLVWLGRCWFCGRIIEREA